MLKNKKGDVTLGQFALFITLLASALVILLIFKTSVAQAGEKGPENVCHASVVARTNTNFNLYENTNLNLGRLMCKTIDPPGISGDRETIKKKIADKMAKCWWMFNEGRQDSAFSGNAEKIARLFGWETGNPNKCFLCYRLSIEEEEIDGGEIKYNELYDFMKDNPYQIIKGKTYQQYIQNHGGPGAIALLGNVKPERLYGIAYMTKTEDKAGWGWMDAAAGVAVVGSLAACITGVGCTIPVAVIGSLAIDYSAEQIDKYIDSFYREERGISTVVFDDLDRIKKANCLEE